MSRKANEKINEFILANVEANPGEIASLTAKRFKISRETTNSYLRRLVGKGLLDAEGKTKARTYKLKPIVAFEQTIPIAADTAEDVIWREKILPALRSQEINANVIDICNYGKASWQTQIDPVRRFELKTGASLQIIKRDIGILAHAQFCHFFSGEVGYKPPCAAVR